MHKYNISVVIPSTRAGESFDRCLKSALNQTYQIDKIYVVFNGPIVENFSSDYVINIKIIDPRIEIICRSDVTTAPVARNIGLSYVDTELVHFLDDDDFIEVDFYENTISSFAKYSDVVGVSSSSKILSDDTGKIIGSSYRVKRNVTFNDLMIENYLGVTSGTVLQTKFVQKVNGFDESMPARQDYLLWLRLSKLGDFRALKNTSLIWTDHTKFKSISNNGDLDRHKKAIIHMRSIKKELDGSYGLRLLKIESNHQKYLAKICKKNGNICFIWRGLMSFSLWPNISVLSVFANKRMVSLAKDILQK